MFMAMVHPLTAMKKIHMLRESFVLELALTLTPICSNEVFYKAKQRFAINTRAQIEPHPLQ